MYTLYTDKSEDFKCNIGVEGAKISDTQARLVLQNDTVDLMFEGKVSNNGDCVIPIKKLKNILEEGTTGNLKLEVIAEDTFFSPWEDEFEVKTNKRVTVEVENSSKGKVIKENKIQVKVSTPKKTTQSKPSSTIVNEDVNHGEIIAKLLIKKGITLETIKENTDKVNTLIKKYTKTFNLNESPTSLIPEILNNL